jgi:hypothetical protein
MVRTLDSLPPSARRTSAYAAQFDSVRHMVARADSLRRARERWRRAVVSRQSSDVGN